jgi:hypothetical protein
MHNLSGERKKGKVGQSAVYGLCQSSLEKLQNFALIDIMPLGLSEIISQPDRRVTVSTGMKRRDKGISTTGPKLSHLRISLLSLQKRGLEKRQEMSAIDVI